MKKKIFITSLLFFSLTLMISTSSASEISNSVETTLSHESKNIYESIDAIENGSESGRDHMTGLDESPLTREIYPNFQKEGTYILNITATAPIYKTPNKNSIINYVGLGNRITSTLRQGYYFKVDTFAGNNTWVNVLDAGVQLREIEPMSNDDLQLSKTVSLYSQPFSGYPAISSVGAQKVKVLKKSGSWYLINTWLGEYWIYDEKAQFTNVTSEFNVNSVYGAPYRKQIVNANQENIRPGNTMKPQFITIHNTGNSNRGANAAAHANVLTSGNGGSETSWHFTVDDKEVVQSLPLNENGWHAGDGDGPGNRSTIAIEICQNSDGNYSKAEENAYKLVAFLMKQYNLNINQVKQHYDWSGKNCPQIIREQTGWGNFKNKVQAIYDSNNVVPKPLDYRISIGTFAGENNAKQKLEQLKLATGWYANLSKSAIAPYDSYKIVTGEFSNESSVIQAVNRFKSETGWWATHSESGRYTDYYIVKTGAFNSKESVDKALEKFKSETGWWATTEKIGANYRIVTGEFLGEAGLAQANAYMSKVNWWSESFKSGRRLPFYVLTTGEFSDSNALSKAQEYMNSQNWRYQNVKTGTKNYYYNIVTGGFGTKEKAQTAVDFVQNNYGWWSQIESF